MEEIKTTIPQKIHILVISQYFYPEQFRINDICQEWIKRGYKVTVLTGIPNYPQGKFYQGYGWFKNRRENWHGIDIIRIPLIARGSGSAGMVMNYLSFPVSGFFWNLVNKIQADKVFMFETSPMTQCLIGVRYAKKHHVPLYLYAQDLWPQNVEVVTGIHSKAIIRPIQKMVDKIYRACTDIFVTSPSFAEEVTRRGIPVSKVHYWPQYAEDFYQPVTTTAPNQNTDDIFRVVFTGNVGYAQGLDILPRTARILKERNISNVHFKIVGDGRYMETFKNEIQDVAEMFELTGRLSPEQIPDVMAECDVAFVSFQNNDLWKKTIPAKLQSYMACAMPVLAVAEGETARVIREARCGVCTPLGDADALADVIVAMQHMSKDKLIRTGQAGLKYSQEHFNKQKLLDEMDMYLQGQKEQHTATDNKGLTNHLKILMINVVCGIRSTGRICTDIAAELEKQGHKVKIAYGREEVSEQYKKYAVRIGTDTDVKLHGLKARLADGSGFGSKKATRKFLQWVEEYDPDVIHLHNIHGYYLNIPLLFDYLKTCGKKIIWTMHDCWAFTGHSAHCSYSDCERWVLGCDRCPHTRYYPASLIDRSHRNWLRKKEIMGGVPNLTIISPSVWLADQIRKSFLAQYPVHVIHNGIDTELFQPKSSAFKRYNQIEDKIMVLGVSTEWTDMKGFPDYLSLAEDLQDTCQVVLVGLSEEQCRVLPAYVIGIPRTNNVQELVSLYCAADVFINLSYCENYPTVNLEAQACGTPVITYNAGGSDETITEQTGTLENRGNVKSVERDILHYGIKTEPVQIDRNSIDRKTTVQNYLKQITEA